MRKSWLTAASAFASAVAAQGHSAELYSPPSPVQFGDVRVGTSASASASVVILEPIDSGQIAAATAPFSGGPVSMVTTTKTELTPTYGFTPTTSGSATENLNISAINLNLKIEQPGTLTLSGTGVGPLYQSTPAPGGTINFGTVAQGTTGVKDLLVSNGSTDPGAPALTGLTLLTAGVTGGVGFTLANFTAGTILNEGNMFDLKIDFSSLTSGPESATLAIQTDQGAALGTAGAVFDYTLTANVAPAPEPSALAALAGLGAYAGFAAIRRRRRTG